MNKQKRAPTASTSFQLSSDSESDPYQTDEDTEYYPDTYDESDREKLTEPEIDDLDQNGLVQDDNIHVTPRRARKRRKNMREWARQKVKRARLSGNEYATAKGKIINKREVKPYTHRCRYNCNKISEEQRMTLFRKYYELQTYDLQTQYLASCINKTATKRSNNQAASHKNFGTNLCLMDLRVCKNFFIKTFDISNRRYRVVCQKKTYEGFTEPDKRGTHIPSNKIDANTRNYVIQHIKMFPRYKSHYSRSQNSNTCYLPEDLSITKMYSLYTEWCKDTKNIVPVKESYYRKTFCTEFNLKFHKPHSDTCHTCDRLNNLMQNSVDVPIKVQSKNELELHQKKVDSVKLAKKRDIEYGRQNPEKVRVVCFDLQKTLPTPLLTTKKVYYLCQLWTYNLCIQDLVSGESSMYIWNETIGQRGLQEIGSCLLKYIKSLPASVEHLIGYSDQCGGQNKNKNIVKLFMFLVQSTSVKIIDHKFFEPGHSYMECDRSFARIEKAKKSGLSIFVPQDWSEVIKKTSKKFKVYDMQQTDFVSFEYLNSIMLNPKKDTEKKIFKWREIVWFTYKKEYFLSFLFKITRNSDFPFTQSENCSILKPGRPNLSLENLKERLYQDVVKIQGAKWENLKQLLPYIPPIHHKFYENMSHHENKSKKSNKTQNESQPNNTVLENNLVQDDDTELFSDDEQ